MPAIEMIYNEADHKMNTVTSKLHYIILTTAVSHALPEILQSIVTYFSSNYSEESFTQTIPAT